MLLIRSSQSDWPSKLNAGDPAKIELKQASRWVRSTLDPSSRTTCKLGILLIMRLTAQIQIYRILQSIGRSFFCLNNDVIYTQERLIYDFFRCQ